jgi:prephenate dehydrogenase
VTIVGVGLIGGSIGLALRGRGLAERVIGVGRSESRLEEAVRLGAIDEFTTELARGVAEAEVCVVCTPVTRIAADAIAAAEHGPADLLVTDAGSTKRLIVEAVERHERARAAFIGAHPIAGSEQTGVAHARGGLFDGRACVVTPTPHSPVDRIARAVEFWASLGCRVVERGPAEHDAALALTSHLPHVVAAALALAVPAELLELAAGAYRDGTRVAAADTELWAAIFRDNRLPLLEAVDAFGTCLAAFRRALAEGDEEALRSSWDAAKRARAQFDSVESARRAVGTRAAPASSPFVNRRTFE